MEITAIKLDVKGVSKLSFLLHKTLNDSINSDILINNYKLDDLINTKHNGLITNLLNIYIYNKNDKMITEILDKIEILTDFKLMKRDYLNLINYYYSIDYDKSIYIFDNYIYSQDPSWTLSYQNRFILLNKDIDFLIQNKLYKILQKLDGLFIDTPNFLINNELTIHTDCNNLKLYYLSEFKINNILEKVELLIPPTIIKSMNSFLIKNNKYNIILDAGNIIHNRKGIICNNSINDLNKIINYYYNMNYNILVIIHKKHIKIYPKILDICNNINISYYLTPYNYNDDLFIIWFFLKSIYRPYIISNDKYTDHIFNLDIATFDKTLEFKYIIKQQTLNYNTDIFYIEKMPSYSHCIQIIDNIIYIPYLINQFISININ